MRKQQPPLSTKSTTTISAGINSYAYERVSVSVEQGERYSISWSADNPADEDTVYAIEISSYDTHGSYSETFRRRGSWSFKARTTGEIKFAIGVSISGGNVFSRWGGAYDVDIDIS
ncbi:hypothetical protein [Aliiroseovarius sp.]|uniref:hypothetical protein n=1 Tax=Aliiroseovarius sp. TaxID=1872442 RepID=UPI003BA99F2A